MIFHRFQISNKIIHLLLDILIIIILKSLIQYLVHLWDCLRYLFRFVVVIVLILAFACITLLFTNPSSFGLSARPYL